MSLPPGPEKGPENSAGGIRPSSSSTSRRKIPQAASTGAGEDISTPAILRDSMGNREPPDCLIKNVTEKSPCIKLKMLPKL
jgi:hypothetical protein